MILKYIITSLILILSSLIVHAQVTVTKDIDYLTDVSYDDDKDLLDIYMPEGKKDMPVIVYVHGGALLQGNKTWGAVVGQKIAATAGIGLVSVNYRLSPGFQHPAHLNDAAAATAWVIKNIARYGGDPQRVYIAGHSAGAYLAALVAIDPSVMESQDVSDAKLSGAILISPFLFVEETAPDRIARDTIYKSIWGNDAQGWMRASVTPHIKPEQDNILLVYADGDDDWRKEQINRFAKKMTTVGNHRILTEEIAGRDHSSIITAVTNDDDRVVKLIADFVLHQ